MGLDLNQGTPLLVMGCWRWTMDDKVKKTVDEVLKMDLWQLVTAVALDKLLYEESVSGPDEVTELVSKVGLEVDKRLYEDYVAEIGQMEGKE